MRSSGEMLRRARGYVPDALPLPPGLETSAADVSRRGYEKYLLPGARQRSGAEPHFGDLGEEGIEQQWRSALKADAEHLQRLCRSGWWADAHPGYRSTQWAASLPLPLETVLHHLPRRGMPGGAPLAA